MRLAALPAAALAAALCCGGRVETADGGDGGATSVGAADAAHDSGWTACSSPSGFSLCGGPNHCEGCATCEIDALGPEDIRPCEDHPPYYGTGCSGCPDGSICILDAQAATTDAPIFGVCFPWDDGQLFALNGLANRVLYADMNDFTGDPLPEPPTCPNTPGLTLCGGACGPCPPKDFCFGRSPEHPYSVCASQISGNGSSCRRYDSGPGTLGCLIFKDPSNQARADNNGYVVDKPTCEAAAAMYPGGAYCAE